MSESEFTLAESIRRQHGRLSVLPSRELLLECAPLGNLARKIHHHLNFSHLPGWYSIVAILSIFPACFGLYWIAVLADSMRPIVSYVNILVLIVLIVALGALLPILFRPTHLGVSAKGVRNHWKRSIPVGGRFLQWDQIRRIIVTQHEQSTRNEQKILSFVGEKRSVSVKLSEIADIDRLPILYDMIDSYAHETPRDPEIASLLGAEKFNASYTELWLNALAAAPARSRMAPLEEGNSIADGEYVVRRRLGGGGQGVAYLAERNNSTFVVLKEYVLPVGSNAIAQRQAIEKLQREAHILEKLNHPNIANMLDFVFEDHRGYIVLEYVDGTNLSVLVRRDGALSEASVGQLCLQMCSILSYLHSQQPPVVHRDFTPDNLILSKDGSLKLIDFNVAEQKSATTTATVVGKHSYIAPEQFRGQPGPQSDIYSMGATLYFLLTRADPRPISVLKPKEQVADLSDWMNALVERCTAFDTSDRFGSVEEIVQMFKVKDSCT